MIFFSAAIEIIQFHVLFKVIDVVAVLSVTVINQVASSACSHLFFSWK